MPGILPNEGETLVANLLFKNADIDRGVGLELLLFTNATIDETITAATITEPTGTGYAPIPLADGSWTITNGVATYALQTFIAGAGGWPETVYGYAIRTTGTTPRIMQIEVDPNGPYTFLENNQYEVTPTISVPAPTQIESQDIILERVINNSTTDRGTDLDLVLFTNATIDANTTAATLIQPTGGGYTHIVLSDASWTVTNDVASYALQTFSANGGDFTPDVHGIALITKGSTPRLLSIKQDAAGPYTMSETFSLDVTPNITVA